MLKAIRYKVGPINNKYSFLLTINLKIRKKNKNTKKNRPNELN